MFCYVVRFILDDSALYLSDKCEADVVDLRRGKMLINCVQFTPKE